MCGDQADISNQIFCFLRSKHTTSTFRSLQRIILALPNCSFFNYLRCLLRYKPEGCGFDSQRNHEFSLTSFFLPHYGPGFDSAWTRNEDQEYFLWGKGGKCVELTTLPHSCVDCLEILGALTLRRLMSYIYGAPILDVSRSHTTTQHSR